MTIRLGLMGFGRIGRNVFRLVHDRDDLDVVAIADIADPEALTYLLKYDSIYGRFPAPVDYSSGTLQYGDKRVAFTDHREPGEADWADLGVDVVLETTSRYRTKESLNRHLEAGARKVVLTSSPETPGEVPLLLRGINDDVLTPDTNMVALGSNTSNAIAPILEVLDLCDGTRTGRVIVETLAQRWQNDEVSTSRTVLPILGELQRLHAISCEEGT